jgi:GNAT superfamily N-acetyltransferase
MIPRMAGDRGAPGGFVQKIREVAARGAESLAALLRGRTATVADGAPETPRRARRTYLEMRAPGALRAAAPPREPLVAVAVAADSPPDLYRSLYRGVGEAYHWVDRAGWTDADIRAHLARAEVAVFVGRVGDEIAGFFELRDWPDGSTEIAYFGLLPAFIGRGLGGALLTEALRRAWGHTATRVWLHTSSLDHPAALANYQARGLTVVRVEEYAVT